MGREERGGERSSEIRVLEVMWAGGCPRECLVGETGFSRTGLGFSGIGIGGIGKGCVWMGGNDGFLGGNATERVWCGHPHLELSTARPYV